MQVAVPIADEVLRQQLRDVLALCLCDGVDAWDMTPAGVAAASPPSPVTIICRHPLLLRVEVLRLACPDASTQAFQSI